MLRIALVIALASLAFATPSLAQTPPLTDAQFVEKAFSGNRFEVESGRLAQSKATDAKLKQFADMMVSDHGKALSELQEFAKSRNLPRPDKLGVPHQAKLDALKGKDAAAFDAAYKSDMKSAHAETLSMLKSHRQSTKDDALKAWIDKSIPTVERHKSIIDSM